MTRDPSDGSIRERPDVQLAGFDTDVSLNVSHSKNLLSTSTSGLPINKVKADFLARLQRSREQLAEYRASGKFQRGE